MENNVVSKSAVAEAISNTTIADSILNNFTKLVGQEAIVVPEGYAYGNQLKLAYLKLSQEGKIKNVTPASIGEALVDMTLQGLEIEKDQCYFIAYGPQLKLFRSYFGDIAGLESTGLVQANTTKAVVVYECDRVEIGIEDDEEIVTLFEPCKDPFKRHDSKIIGAYAVTTLVNGRKRYCFMSKAEIDKSWSKSKDPSRNVQKDFPQEMSKRTVIRRLAKMITKASKNLGSLTEQQKLAIYAYNKTTEDQYQNKTLENGTYGKTTIHNSIVEENNELEEENYLPDTAEAESSMPSTPLDSVEENSDSKIGGGNVTISGKLF